MNAIVAAIAKKAGLSESAANTLIEIAEAGWEAIPQETRDRWTGKIINEAKEVGWQVARAAADYALSRISHGAPPEMFNGVDLIPISPPMDMPEGGIPLAQAPSDFSKP